MTITSRGKFKVNHKRKAGRTGGSMSHDRKSLVTQLYVEIEYRNRTARRTYRFFGCGIWKMDDGDGFQWVNAIYVPAAVLKKAAENCHPIPQQTPH